MPKVAARVRRDPRRYPVGSSPRLYGIAGVRAWTDISVELMAHSAARNLVDECTLQTLRELPLLLPQIGDLDLDSSGAQIGKALSRDH